MKRPRLLALAAGCLGFALDVGALVLEGLGLVIFAARAAPRMGSCSTCGKRRDVYMLRADGVCRYCAAPAAVPVKPPPPAGRRCLHPLCFVAEPHEQGDPLCDYDAEPGPAARRAS